MTSPPRRVLPTTEGQSAFFWRSGADGTLRFLQCSSCRYLIHPPTSFCPRCHSRGSEPTAVSGRGTVYSYTVNHQPWDGSPNPYVIAVVEIVEQQDLRLMTNLVDVEPEDVRIGAPVEVVFEDLDPTYLPLFRPVTR